MSRGFPSSAPWDGVIGVHPFAPKTLRTWHLSRRGSDPSELAFLLDSEVETNTPTAAVLRNDKYYVSFEQQAQFEICFQTKTIVALNVAPDTDEATLTHILFDHLIPRILAHQGHLILHGSAVAMDGRVAIFLGDTGAGKSTLAASLHAAGHQLLGDDAVVVSSGEHGFLAQAVYPSLRLFPDTIETLFGESADVHPMAGYSDKQRVTLEAPDHTKPLPVGAIFILSDEIDVTIPQLHRPGPAQACIWALEQSFSLDPHDAARAAHRMSEVSALIEGVDTFLLDYPRAYDRLADVHRLIARCMAGGAENDKAAG